jgi:hypothetical protein
MATDQDVLARIKALVDEEHVLRARHEQQEIGDEEEAERLHGLEVALDQCWDLLRQRRALRETGRNPDGAHTRPADEVEGYLG